MRTENVNNPADTIKLRTKPRSQLLRIDLLYAFEAAARLSSFTRAASELSVTQSAVSRQIQQLEENLQSALFERTHRAIALTPAGQILFRAVGTVSSAYWMPKLAFVARANRVKCPFPVPQGLPRSG